MDRIMSEKKSIVRMDLKWNENRHYPEIIPKKKENRRGREKGGNIELERES